jgi:hypothetical protein
LLGGDDEPVVPLIPYDDNGGNVDNGGDSENSEDNGGNGDSVTPLEPWSANLSAEEDALCQRLMAAFADGDIDEIYDIIESEAFVEILQTHAVSSNDVLNFDYGNTVDGVGYSISYVDLSGYDHFTVFYGGWENGLAHGDGVMLNLSVNRELDPFFDVGIRNYSFATSHWIDGFAHGETETIENGTGTPVIANGVFSAATMRSVATGWQERGLWQGVLIRELFFDDVFEERIQITFVDGVATVTGEQDGIAMTGINLDTGEATPTPWIEGSHEMFINITFRSGRGNGEDPHPLFFLTSSLPYRLAGNDSMSFEWFLNSVYI